MHYFPPMVAFLLFILFFDNGYALENNLQIQVPRIMEELLDLKEDFADLQKDIVNMRRHLNQDRLNIQTLIGNQNKTICYCPMEGGAGWQDEFSSLNANEKYRSSFLNHVDLKKLDMMLKGLAKEKAIRISFVKKIDAMEETYGQNLSDLAMNIENVEKHIENRLSAKTKASEVAFGIKLENKLSTIEQKLNERLSKLNQTFENIREPIEKWRLDQEDCLEIQCWRVKGHSKTRLIDAYHKPVLHITFANGARDAKTAVQPCEDGWREFQGSCYSFIHTNMSWLSAEQYCQAFNSHLLRIDDHTEYQFILGVLNELHQITLKEGIQHISFYWTAGNDIMKEGHWVWSPRNVPIRYEAWFEMEPNNAFGQEDCAELASHRQFKMNDLNCEYKVFFICEIDRKNG